MGRKKKKKKKEKPQKYSKDCTDRKQVTHFRYFPSLKALTQGTCESAATTEQTESCSVQSMANYISFPQHCFYPNYLLTSVRVHYILPMGG